MKILFGAILFAMNLMLLPEMGEASVIQSGQSWNLLFIRGPIHESHSLEYYVELQPRLDFETSNLSRILLRPALIYHLDSDQSLWLGVMDVFDIEFITKELRVWEQYQRNDHFGHFVLLNRSRFEQRFAIGERGTGIRFRQMIRGQFPLFEKSDWTLVVFDEFFFAFNSHRLQPHLGFDQNRAFLGVRNDLENHLFYEFGYLNQFTGTRMNHIPFLTIGKAFR